VKTKQINTYLTAFFQDNLGKLVPARSKPFRVVMKQEIMRWQMRQLEHTQIICILFQTDNHANTSSLNFYRPDALPDAQPTVSKH